MADIDRAQKKWERKTKAAVQKWKEIAGSSESFEAFVSGVSNFAGIPEGTVRSSFPAKSYKEFQSNIEQYARKFQDNIERAAREGSWKANYKRAFQHG